MLDIQLPKAEKQITHHHKILSVGSCFTEHIGTALADLKFNVLQNPSGILFDPSSVSSSLISYIQNKQYTNDDLFQLNEVWQSWQHHGRFSGVDKENVLSGINESQMAAHQFLKETNWLIITLGTSFSYRLKKLKHDGNLQIPLGTGAVANCHRAPAQWFEKYMMPAAETIESLEQTIHQLFQFNREVNIIFTISPVRHIRDGVVDNNRSKARLIEAVHHLVNKLDRLYYFPAYELVIDILRDYRFYSEDMVHPNYLATDFVLAKFLATYTGGETSILIKEVQHLNIAQKHKPSHPTTQAHKKFLKTSLEKVQALEEQYPHINFKKEIDFFSNEVNRDHN